MIRAAVPAKSAEAKANPDVSNVVNKNISQVAKYLKIEKFKEKDDFFNMITYNKPKKVAKMNMLLLYHLLNRNKKETGASIYEPTKYLYMELI